MFSILLLHWIHHHILVHLVLLLLLMQPYGIYSRLGHSSYDKVDVLTNVLDLHKRNKEDLVHCSTYQLAKQKHLSFPAYNNMSSSITNRRPASVKRLTNLSALTQHILVVDNGLIKWSVDHFEFTWTYIKIRQSPPNEQRSRERRCELPNLEYAIVIHSKSGHSFNHDLHSWSLVATSRPSLCACRHFGLSWTGIKLIHFNSSSFNFSATLDGFQPRFYLNFSHFKFILNV